MLSCAGLTGAVSGGDADECLAESEPWSQWKKNNRRTVSGKRSHFFRRDFQRMMCPWNREAMEGATVLSTRWVLILCERIVRSDFALEVKY